MNNCDLGFTDILQLHKLTEKDLKEEGLTQGARKKFMLEVRQALETGLHE